MVKELCNVESGEPIQPGPQMLLLKLLYRKFGEMELRNLHQKPDMSWILPAECLLSHHEPDKNVYTLA